LEEFYRNVSPDWIEQRSLLSLLSPSTVSLVDNASIRTQVELAVDDDLIADLSEAHAEGRQIVIGTVNLDYGGRRYWDIARLASITPDPKPLIVDILMAATAIPGVFAPVEIDGKLHADGGAVQGVPGIPPEQLPRLAAAWRERYGDRPLPTIRFWYVFNNQLALHPEAVGLSWVDVVYRSYQTISQTSFKAPVLANVIQAGTPDPRLPEIEVRWVAIPDSYVADPDARPFDPAVTNELADLGREVADRPDGGWRSDYPG
jgi:hypothetical protein